MQEGEATAEKRRAKAKRSVVEQGPEQREAADRREKQQRRNGELKRRGVWWNKDLSREKQQTGGRSNSGETAS
ncbi:UNVERIFIED_CONTAM: hypothetical protein FKN15_044081 [Acipenser sinensis]